MPSPAPGPTGASASPVANWSVSTKLFEAARRATPKLPPEMQAQFASLFTAKNAEITGGVLAFWAASHFFGVGEIADVVLLGIGVVSLGAASFGVGWELGTYLRLAANARTEIDLDAAASHLAQAVVTMGVAAFIALIMKAGSRIGAGMSGAAETEETVTVGRWIRQSEYDDMVRTGRVQESPEGGKNVLYPADPAGWKDAPKGFVNVEFEVPKSVLEGKSVGQRTIPGPKGIHGRLAAQRGLPLPEMPLLSKPPRIMGRK